MADRVARFVEMTAPEREGALLDEMVQRMCGVGSPAGECEGLPAICRAWDVPYGKVLMWLMADEDRYAVYQRAVEVQAHALMEDVIGIADSGEDVQRDKLRVDTRFRKAKHLAPKVWGEKVEHVGVVAPVFTVNIMAGSPAPGAQQPAALDGDAEVVL